MHIRAAAVSSQSRFSRQRTSRKTAADSRGTEEATRGRRKRKGREEEETEGDERKSHLRDPHHRKELLAGSESVCGLLHEASHSESELEVFLGDILRMEFFFSSALCQMMKWTPYSGTSMK